MGMCITGTMYDQLSPHTILVVSIGIIFLVVTIIRYSRRTRRSHTLENEDMYRPSRHDLDSKPGKDLEALAPDSLDDLPPPLRSVYHHKEPNTFFTPYDASDLPPPLRSVYHPDESHTFFTPYCSSTSPTFSAFHPTEPHRPGPWTRHSYTHPGQQPTSTPTSSDSNPSNGNGYIHVIDHGTQFFPVTNPEDQPQYDDLLAMTERPFWRRRTLTFATPLIDTDEVVQSSEDADANART